MGFVYLVLTILFEAIGFYFLNKAEGFQNIKFLIFGIILLNFTTISFAMALKTIDLTMGNVLWSSCSLILASLIGYFAFGEKYSFLQYSLIALIIICVVLLNFSGIKK